MAKPQINTILPAPNTTNVTATNPISFRLDADVALVVASTFIYVRGELVYDGTIDTFSSAWAVSTRTANPPNGQDFVLVPDSTKTWGFGEVIEVSFSTADVGGETLASAWIFTGTGEALGLEMYPMLISSLRHLDERGDGLLKKLYSNDPDNPGGYDYEWSTKIFDRASVASDLIDPAVCPAEWLSWLSTQVGLTRNMVFTSTEEELRTIIKFIMQMWADKPSEVGFKDAVRMITGNRFRIRNYFDLRMQSDWSYITELLDDQDPNVLDFPSGSLPSGSDFRFNVNTPVDGTFQVVDLGPESVFLSGLFRSKYQFLWFEVVEYVADPTLEGFYRIDYLGTGTDVGYIQDLTPFIAKVLSNLDVGKWRLWGGQSDFLTEIRVVDRDTLLASINKTLLVYLLGLCRPSSERIDIVYIDFLDEFFTPDDTGQWDSSLGSGPVIPSPGGYATLGAGDGMLTNTGPMSGLGEFSGAFKIYAETTGLAQIIGINFCRQSATDHNRLEVDYTTQTLRLYAVAGGVPALLFTSAVLPTLLRGFEDVIRVDLTYTGVGDVDNLYRVRFNGDLVVEFTEAAAAFQAGNFEITSITGASRVYLVEAMELPVSVERVGPNP